MQLVLIIEDDILSGHLYRAALHVDPALALVEAADSLVGLFLLVRLHPDLVVFDWHVPGLSGSTWLAAKEDTEKQNGLEPIPVIVVTADYGVQRLAARRQLGHGVHAVLAKPVLPEDIRTAVRDILHRTGSAR